MKKVLIISLMILSLIGCKLKYPNIKPYQSLTEETIINIGGRYKHYACKNHSKESYPQYSTKEYLRMNTSLMNRVINSQMRGVFARAYDTIQKPPLNKYYAKLILSNKSELEVSFYENNVVLRSKKIKGKLQNGKFYLENVFRDSNGIPGLYGWSSTSSSSIGVLKNGNLIVNSSSSSYGAFLFLFFGSSDSSKVSYEFERIK